MQFRDYAGTETAALIGRIMEGPDKALQDLDAFRQVLADAGRRVDEIAARLRAANHDEHVSSLVEKLTTAANAGAQTLVQRAQTEAQTQLQRLQADADARVERTRAEGHSALERARGELEARLAAETAELGRLRAAFADAQRSVDALRSDCEAALEREEAAIAREQAATEREKAAAAREKAARAELAAREKAGRDAEKAAADREKALRTELAARSKTTAEGGPGAAVQEKAIRAELAAEIQDLKQRLSAAHEAMEHERRLAAEAAERGGIAAGQPGGRRVGTDGSARTLDDVLDIFHDVAIGETVRDVMVSVARGLSHDFKRVALFNVKGKRLEGVYQNGFDFASDISKLALPLGQESLLAAAIESGRVEARSAGDKRVAAPPPFDKCTGCALALPIVVRGQALGVIYADDADRPADEAAELDDRVKVAEILQQHAAPRVDALVAEQRTLDELRAYAKLLLDEVENMYAADSAAGVKDADLQSRLREHLECAVQMFEQRVTSEGPAAAGLLDERLADMLEAKQNHPFGRDLKAVASRKAKKPDTPRKASAR